MNGKKKNLLIIGAAIAFVVVLTILILLALEFDIFGLQDPQSQQPSVPVEQEAVVNDPDDNENQEGDTQQPSENEENEENEGDTQQPDENEENEGGLIVGVEDGSNTETQTDPDEDKNVISFDDLLNAAQKNEGQ